MLGVLAGCGEPEVWESPPAIELPEDLQHPEAATPAPMQVVDQVIVGPGSPVLEVRAPGSVRQGDLVWLQLSDVEGIAAGARTRWVQTSGPEVVVHDADAPSAWFEAPQDAEGEELSFAVDVDLGDGLAGFGEVTLLIGGGDGDAGRDDEPAPEPEPEPVTGLAVFRAEKDLVGRRELYATALGGGEPVRLNGPLPPGSDVGAGFRISPDGRYVIFQVFGPGTATAHIARTDGSALVDVLLPETRPVSFGPDRPWAPDSSRVAIVSEDGRVFTVRPNGSGLTQVSLDPVPGGFVRADGVAWSSDARYLAFRADHNVDNVVELWVTGPRGGPRRVSAPMPVNGDVQSFAWSPRGDRLAYWADQSANNVFELFSVRRDGSENVSLSGVPFDPGSYDRFVGWAPDGSRVLYLVGQLASRRELFTTRADGTGNVRVAIDLGDGNLLGGYRWLPTSDGIIYGRYGTATSAGIYVTGAEGEATRAVLPASTGERPTGPPFVSSDGRYAANDFFEAGTGARSRRVVDLETLTVTEVAAGATSLGLMRWVPSGTHLIHAASFGTSDLLLLAYRVADGANPIISDGPTLLDGWQIVPGRERVVYIEFASMGPNRLFVTSPDADVPVRDVSGFITAGGGVDIVGVP